MGFQDEVGFSTAAGRKRKSLSLFLVDGSGQVIARYDSRVKPLDPEVVEAIEKDLPK